MVAQAGYVVAAQQTADPKPRLVGHRHDHRAAADSRQLAERRDRILEVFEHLEAEDDIEAVVGEGQLVHACLAHVGVRDPAPGELGRRPVDVDRAEVGGKPRGEPDQGLALAAPGVEDRARLEVGDELRDRGVEAVDEPADDRVLGLELGVVRALAHGSIIRMGNRPSPRSAQ
jgi:hypothetical protein